MDGISVELIALAVGMRAIVLLSLLMPLVQKVRALKKERYTTSLLAFLIVCLYWIDIFIEMMFIIFNPQRLTMGKINVFAGILAGILTLYFVESYSSNMINPVKSSIASALAVLSIGISILGSIPSIVITFDQLLPHSIIIMNIFASLFYFFIFFSVFSTLQKLKRVTSDIQHNSITLIQVYTFISFMLSPIAVVTPYVLFTKGDGKQIVYDGSFVDFSIIPHLVISLGVFFFYVGYLRHWKPYLIQPQKIDRLIIISDFGLPLFDKDLTNISTTSDLLVAGAFTSFKTIVEESIKIKGNIKSIEIGDLFLLFRSSEDFFILMFTSRPSKFLHNALNIMHKKLVELGVKYDLTNSYYEEICKVVESILGI